MLHFCKLPCKKTPKKLKKKLEPFDLLTIIVMKSFLSIQLFDIEVLWYEFVYFSIAVDMLQESVITQGCKADWMDMFVSFYDLAQRKTTGKTKSKALLHVQS